MTLSYTAPTANPLRDQAGNTAASFSGQTVTNNTEATPLTAKFPASPYQSKSHSGTDDQPQVIVAYSQAVSTLSASTPSLSLTGATIRRFGTHREEGLDHAWIFYLAPSGTADIQFSLVTGQAFTSGGICTGDGTTLSLGPQARTITGPAQDQTDSQEQQPDEENTPATGAPTISGKAQVGETLTASTSGIADQDGLNNADFSYQWVAGGSNIAGVNGSSYTPTSSEEGKTIQVRVSFRDDAGNEESLTSTATAAVAAAPSPLTASFENVPSTHDGQNTIIFQLHQAPGRGPVRHRRHGHQGTARQRTQRPIRGPRRTLRVRGRERNAGQRHGLQRLRRHLHIRRTGAVQPTQHHRVRAKQLTPDRRTWRSTTEGRRGLETGPFLPLSNWIAHLYAARQPAADPTRPRWLDTALFTAMAVNPHSQ